MTVTFDELFKFAESFLLESIKVELSYKALKVVMSKILRYDFRHE